MPPIATTSQLARNGQIRRSALALAAAPAIVPAFRRHTRQTLAAWEVPDDATRTAAQLVTELAANAVQASAGLRYATVGLRLSSYEGAILVRVHDGSSAMPAVRQAQADDESGRGLLLVDCLAAEWGAYRTAAGKIVWCVIDTGQHGTNGS